MEIMTEIEVISPGFYSTIQDMGRVGFAKYGVPKSGCMDSFSAKKANLLVGNDSNDAVLEITMTGPTLVFHGDSSIAISGAQFDLQLNDCHIENDKAYKVSAGDKLVFNSLREGFRAYLAISGGFQTMKLLDSRSMYEEITDSIKIERGDRLPIISKSEEKENKGASVNFEIKGIFENEINLYEGPEFYLLRGDQKELLFKNSFTVSQSSNRMAIQMKEDFQNNLKGIVTGPVVPGTVQLTPGGTLIILMRDCQVTGGYPRILQLSELGICTLAQKRPGDSVFFKLLTP
tara:strand:+ start:989 stop:1855 length:867 start_codon:yes stop_codon:yes gene_type:complete